MKAGKIILILLLVVALVGGGVFAYLWFMTDMFKSPKSMFDTYSDTLKAELNKFSNKDAMSKYIDQIQSEDFTVKASIDAAFKNGSKSVDFDDILEIEGSRDASGKNSQTKVTVNYSDKESFDAEFVVNENLYGMFFDGVTTSYLGFNLDNIEEWLENMDVDEDTIASVKDTLEKSKEYDVAYLLDKYEEYSKKYAGIVKKNIPESAYTKSDDKDDKSITLTIDSKTLSKIFEEVAREGVKDIQKLAEKMGDEAAEELDLEEFEESLEEAVDEIKESNISVIYKLEKPEEGKSVVKVTIKKDKQKIQATVTIEDNKVTIDIMGMVDIVITKKEQGKKVTYTANLQLSESAASLMGSSDMEDYKFEYVLTYDGLGTSTVEEEELLTIKYSDYSFEISSEGKVEFGEVDIEELSKSNTQFIDELSAEETEQLFEALGQRLGEVNAEKIQKSGFLTKIQDLSNIFSMGGSSSSLMDLYDDDEDDDYDFEDDEEDTEYGNELLSEEDMQMLENSMAYINSLGIE